MQLLLAAALLRRQTDLAQPAAAVSTHPDDAACCELNRQCGPEGTRTCEQRPYVCTQRHRAAGETMGTDREYWRNPVLEEKLKEGCEETTDPARCSAALEPKLVPYFPHSHKWYARVRAIADSTPKTVKFCFMGSGSPCRSWVPDFAKRFFDSSSFLGFTDKNSDGDYSPLGVYDKTMTYFGHRPQDFVANKSMTQEERQAVRDMKNQFDSSYFRGLAACEYALAPRGMEPYSMRFYEALAAGALPVLRSELDQRRTPEEFVLIQKRVYSFLKLPENAGEGLLADLLSEADYGRAVAENRRVFEEHHLVGSPGLPLPQNVSILDAPFPTAIGPRSRSPAI